MIFMSRVEKNIQLNPNGSTTIVRRQIEDIPGVYNGTIPVLLKQESHVSWPKSKDIIPNVPSRQRRVELINQLGR